MQRAATLVLAAALGFSSAPAEAATKALVLGPAGESAAAKGVRAHLPSAVAASCGFEVVPASCNELSCAGEATKNTKADYVIAAHASVNEEGQDVLDITLNDARDLRVIGRMVLVRWPTLNELNGLVELAVATLCQQRYATQQYEQDLTPADALTKADIIDGIKAHGGKLGQCIAKARVARQIEPGRVQYILSWTVLPDGTTEKGALLGPPESLLTSLPECFAKVMKTWRFRPTRTGGPVRNYPLPITAY